MSEAPLVCVTIVTYNSARYIGKCLESVLAQDYPALEIVIVDNASEDATRAALEPFAGRARIAYNCRNIGFAAGQNQAIGLSRSDWVLTLNPDVRLSPDFVSQMVAAGELSSEIGSVSGKLLAMGSDFSIPSRPIFDSTGIYMTPALRHFDRGSKQPDEGQYDTFEYVFGVTGAAALYRRKMIADISIQNEFFDTDFFAYREDADVAWRAQLLGWKCLYTPLAVAFHVRSVLPSNRRSVSPLINMHSVKNRWLLRMKNMTFWLYMRIWPAILFRDGVVIAACFLRERSSLGAFAFLGRNMGRIYRKRREIMKRRRTTDAYIGAWFSHRPVSFPASGISTQALRGAKLASR